MVSSCRAFLCCAACPPSKGSVVSGMHYLSSDARSEGYCSVFSYEHGYFIVLLVNLCIIVSLLSLAPSGGSTYAPITYVACLGAAAFLSSLYFPLAVFLDPRVWHTPDMLPLNMAAICNDAGEERGRKGLQRATFSISFYHARSSSSFAEEGENDVLDRLKNVAKFVTKTCDVEARLVPVSFCEQDDDASSASAASAAAAGGVALGGPAAAAECSSPKRPSLPRAVEIFNPVAQPLPRDPYLLTILEGITNAHIAVFVLRSPEEITDWLRCISAFWPESQTVLVSTESAFNAAFGMAGVKRDFDPPNAPLRSLREYMTLIITDDVSEVSPYAGFAPALIDAIGSKVAHAFLSSGNRTIRSRDGLPTSPSFGSASSPRSY